MSGNGGMSQKNNTKKTYQLVNDLTIEKKNKVNYIIIHDDSGKCLIGQHEIHNRTT